MRWLGGSFAKLAFSVGLCGFANVPPNALVIGSFVPTKVVHLHCLLSLFQSADLCFLSFVVFDYCFLSQDI